jgi:hypothetical protein
MKAKAPELSAREVAALFFCVAFAAGDHSMGEIFEWGFEHADAFLSEVKRRRKKKKKRSG